MYPEAPRGKTQAQFHRRHFPLVNDSKIFGLFRELNFTENARRSGIQFRASRIYASTSGNVAAAD